MLKLCLKLCKIGAEADKEHEVDGRGRREKTRRGGDVQEVR